MFSEGPGQTLLEQVQARIRDLVPLAEHAALNEQPPDATDRSIVFHVAHGAQREVEILHDQLLELLAHPPQGRAIDPRDVVVMVPDIAVFAPAVRSVFGQYSRSDARYIPFDIADLQERGNNPLLVAVEWLLRLPMQRCALSEVRDLLDVPAVAARFDLDAEDMPRLAQWLAGAGVRWGLNHSQRDELGLGRHVGGHRRSVFKPTCLSAPQLSAQQTWYCKLTAISASCGTTRTRSYCSSRRPRAARPASARRERPARARVRSDL